MIVVNCGNNASGKSTFSASFVMGIKELNPRATILMINLDTDTPAHAIWEPKRELSRMYSVGTMFENKSIDEKTLAKHIVTLENDKNIGTLGYCLGDSPLSFKDIEYNQIIDTLKAAEQLVDYVVVDCSSGLLTSQLAASIEMANCLNVLITPDPKGVIYLKTFNAMYKSSGKFNVANTNYLLTPVRSYNACKQIKDEFQTSMFELPYSTEIAVKNCEGDVFAVYKNSPRKYKNTIKKILKQC